MKTSTIKGFPNYTVSENGDITSLITGKRLKPGCGKNTYPTVVLRHLGKSYTKSVHRIVMNNLAENPNNYPCVNHKDGNKRNNNLSNLEWCSYSQNVNHANSMGLRTYGEKHRMKMIESGNKMKEKGSLIINTDTGVYYSCINDAIESLSTKISYTRMFNMLNGIVRNKTSFMLA